MSSCTAFDLSPVLDWVENYFQERRLREVARQHVERLRALMERLRDIEHEKKWCSEHDRLREKLAKRGLTSSVKLHIPPATKPVRVVKRDKAPSSTRVTAKPGRVKRA